MAQISKNLFDTQIYGRGIDGKLFDITPTGITIGCDGVSFTGEMKKSFKRLAETSIRDLPKRYIINKKVCVCTWSDGTITKSWNHEDNEFDKEIGFLFCCYQHYYAHFSKNKRTKILSWVNYDKMKEFLLEIFKEKNKFSTVEAKKYLQNLEVEKPKVKKEIERKPKHMKEVTD